MGQLVQPKVFWVGGTTISYPALHAYLAATDNLAFEESMSEARNAGCTDAEILTSFYAKLCYNSLTAGKNANVTRVRDIAANVRNCLEVGHGSVFEHAQLNFIIHNCSRVLTHELTRHRVGTAFSQTSGRYCRLDQIDLVWDPVLDPVRELLTGCLANIENTIYMAECALGLRKPNPQRPNAHAGAYREIEAGATVYGDEHKQLVAEHKWVPIGEGEMDFARKKQLTSALRRIAPNGQANEMGFSVNLRQLRHMILLRTARGAEREIRDVFGQIYRLVKARHRLLFHDAVEGEYDGLLEVTGMTLQPYDRPAG